MTTRNKKIRFMDNNFAELITSSIAKTSELSSFPFTNAINKFRSRVWKPAGNFTITLDSNDLLYINDGADKTVTLTAGDYTYSTLASHIETQLNASSSGWTCTYDTAGGTYKFTIGNSGSVTLRLSETTEAVWNTLGFVTSTDLTGTSFPANEQRNHTSEHVTFDLGYNAEMTFFAMIGPLDEVFSISGNATVTLSASNLNQWDAPPFSLSLSRTDKGIYRFLDDQSDTAYRFWRVEIVDKFNSGGPEGISIGNIYLGDYTTLTTRNIEQGFNISDVDPSKTFVSESGALHFDEKTKYSNLSSIVLPFLSQTEKDDILNLYENLGTTTPFYVALDPLENTITNLYDLTKYVIFASPPTVNHIKTSTYTIGMQFRELV